MRRLQTFRWLKKYPWLTMVLLGLISLCAILTIAFNSPSLQFSAKTSVPASPTVAVTTPITSAKPPLQRTVQASPTSTPTAPKPALVPIKPAHQASLAQLKNVSVDSAIEMHVAIAEGVSSLVVGASAGAEVFDEKGHLLHELPAQASYNLQAGDHSIGFGDWQLPSVVWVESAPNGLISVGDRAYRGRLLLAAQSGRLWAVSYVNLRDYLYSVVGSEVPASWGAEALKAQAVAARSYALVYYLKPASSLYHLGSTESYQVYSGIEREADTTRQAVDRTAGEFVSYRGGIVESLYAASDDIVMSAFEGRGMSQLGAYDLAQKGYTYNQILANYYPGTGVSRIELDQE